MCRMERTRQSRVDDETTRSTKRIVSTMPSLRSKQGNRRRKSPALALRRNVVNFDFYKNVRRGVRFSTRCSVSALWRGTYT